MLTIPKTFVDFFQNSQIETYTVTGNILPEIRFLLFSPSEYKEMGLCRKIRNFQKKASIDNPISRFHN